MRTTLRFTVAAAVAASLIVVSTVTPVQAKKRGFSKSFSSQSSSHKLSQSSNQIRHINSSQFQHNSNTQMNTKMAKGLKLQSSPRVQINSHVVKNSTGLSYNGRGLATKLSTMTPKSGSGLPIGNTTAYKRLHLANKSQGSQLSHFSSNVLGKMSQGEQVSMEKVAKLHPELVGGANSPAINTNVIGKINDTATEANNPKIVFPEGFTPPKASYPNDGPKIEFPEGFEPPKVKFPNDTPGNEGPSGNEPPGNEPPGNEPPENGPPCDDHPHCPKPPCYNPGWCGTVYPWPWTSTPCYGDYGYYYYSQPSIITVPAAPVVVQEQAAPADLELADVRFVDAGDAARRLGPLYRIRVYNVSTTDVTTAFEVALLAAGESSAADKPVSSTARIEALGAGQTVMVDVRLPFEVLGLDRDSAGRRLPFAILYAVVDGQNTVAEVDDGQERNNNVRAWKRDDIRPIDLVSLTAAAAAAE